MPKFEFSPFAENFLETAGKIYLTQEEIREMRRKEKLMRENFKAQLKQRQNIEDMQIAEAIFKAKHPEKFETGHELEARARAEAIREGRPGYITQKKVDVTGMATGKGAGQTEKYDIAKIMDDLQANANARINILNNIKTISINTEQEQKLTNFIADFDTAESEAEVENIYRKAMEELTKQPVDEKTKAVIVDKSKALLTQYRGLTNHRLFLEKQKKLKTGTEIQSETDHIIKLLKAAVNKEKPDKDEIDHYIDMLREKGFTNEQIKQFIK